jgi:hypothetical protein
VWALLDEKLLVGKVHDELGRLLVCSRGVAGTPDQVEVRGKGKSQGVQMTTRNMMTIIGATVRIQCESLTVDCIVLDTKLAYGHVRIQIKPVCGDGTQWVELTRVEIVER